MELSSTPDSVRAISRTTSKSIVFLAITPKMVTGSMWFEPRNQPASSLAILRIFLPELPGHHALLHAHAQEVKRGKGNDSGEARHIIGKNHGLRSDQQPKRRIHRMPDATVNAVGDQFVRMSNLQRRRPVNSKVFVRSPEQPISDDEQRRSQHSAPQGQ